MGKIAETVALDKKKQSKFSNKVKKVKGKVQKGDVVIKETIKQVKPDRGVVYIGHIPHGFYEAEMKEYFKQFGKVTNVRVSRSSRTGQSKGYGFIEFEDTEVAKVVADSMDNYLMFKRRLEAKYIPPAKQNKTLFAGFAWSKNTCNKKFVRDKMNKSKNLNIDNDKYLQKAAKQLKKLQDQLDKLAAMGIKHTLKPVDVPESLTKQLLDNDSDSVYEVNPDDSDIEVKIRKPEKLNLLTKSKDIKSKTIQKKKEILKSVKHKVNNIFSNGKAKLAKSILDNSLLVKKTKINKKKSFIKQK